MEAQALPAPAPAAAKPGAGSYIVAVLIPIIGAILAIIQFARGNTGPGAALLLTSIVAGFIWIMVLTMAAAAGVEADLATYDACIQQADTLAQMGRC